MNQPTLERTRPSKENVHMRMACLIAERSTCLRAQVGCVITDLKHELITMGYNGTYKGGPNHCYLEPLPGQCGCIHAEPNCLSKAPRGPKIAYITHQPCITCAALLVNADVQKVYYLQAYRTMEGINLLDNAGIPNQQLGSPKWISNPS